MNATFSCPGGVPQSPAADAALLAGFRQEVYRCPGRRADAQFGLADAVLCAGGRVTDLARLSLVPECGRGHGGVYDGLNAGRVDFARLRMAVTALPLPRWADGGIRLAADVCAWLRPDAGTSPGRLHCHVHGRGRGGGHTEPGWPYSFVAALGPGASSWALPLDAVRLGPGDDDCAVAAGQLRDVVLRLIEAGQWAEGDPDIMIALDAGYNVTRLAWLLAGLPVVLVARVRSGRVFYGPGAGHVPGKAGQPVRHGESVRCAGPAAQRRPDVEQDGTQARYGPVRVRAWNRMHQMLHRHCAGWEDWPSGHCPLIEGTLICLTVTAAAGPEPMWLWASVPGAGPGEVRALWACYLRRFDIEHLFRFLKRQLGWDKPLLRDPAAADRWTWLLIAGHAQLHLARGLAALARLPWQPKAPAGGILTPGQVRAGFPRVRQALGTPAGARKPSRPGPGRPAGRKNTRKAPRYPVGKTNPKERRPAKNPRKKTKQTG